MIRKATIKDKQKLCNLFSDTLKNHPTYISHGELQMGIATDEDNLAPDFEDKWAIYIDEHLNDHSFSNILVSEENGDIIGFILGTKEEDGDKYYGVINDVCVDQNSRKSGIGAELIDAIFDWFDSEDIKSIYLESGLNNHDAHSFFEKRGFKAVSKVFMLKRD